jgi:hypothetical protein
MAPESLELRKDRNRHRRSAQENDPDKLAGAREICRVTLARCVGRWRTWASWRRPVALMQVMGIEVRRLVLLEEVAGPASALLLHVQAGFRLSPDEAAFAGEITKALELTPWRVGVRFAPTVSHVSDLTRIPPVRRFIPSTPLLLGVPLGGRLLPRPRSSHPQLYAYNHDDREKPFHRSIVSEVRDP